MKTIKLAYGETFLTAGIEEKRIKEIVESPLNSYRSGTDSLTLVQNALDDPVDTAPLSEIAKDKRRIVILANGKHRPTPERFTIPVILDRIFAGDPDADVTVLVATGGYGMMQQDALERRFGRDVMERARFVCHDVENPESMVQIDTLPTGTALYVCKEAVNADLLISEGSIAPHYLAGFTSAAMSVLPGIASRDSIRGAQNAASKEMAGAGVTENNGFYNDILFAARTAGVTFTLNVVLNLDRDIVFSAAGSLEGAQTACEEMLRTKCAISPRSSSYMLLSAGGAPLDHTFWGGLRALTTAEPMLEENSVVILATGCENGVGKPMAWQSRQLERALARSRIVCISEIPDDELADLGLIPADSIESAVRKADRLIGGEQPMTIIPDAASLIVS